MYRSMDRLASRTGMLLCAAWIAAAEQPVTRLYTTGDGLARNSVQRIRRDQRGRLWFCTVEGLSLFDGQKFYNYDTTDGLPHRNVTDILDAGDGFYWLATSGGLYQFRPRRGSVPRFDKVPLPGVPDGAEATVLFRGADGSVWCGTTHALFRIRGGKQASGELTSLDGPGEIANGRYITVLAVAEDGRGSLWIGTGEGLFRHSASVVRRVPLGCGGQTRPMVRALVVDRGGVLWAGFQGGIARLDLRRDPPAAVTDCFGPLDPLAQVQSFHQTADGEMWIGAFGLHRYRPVPAQGRPRYEVFERTTLPASLFIEDIDEDTSGNVWLTVQNAGVMRILRSGFSGFSDPEGLESSYVHSVFEGRDGTLYAVTGAAYTLNRFDGERFHAIRPRLPASVTHFGAGEHAVMLQDRSGDWWKATGMGLLHYTGVARADDLARTPPSEHFHWGNGLPENEIGRICEDRDGGIWAGTTGIARWDRATGRFQDHTAAMRQAATQIGTMTSFAQDASGNVWIGCYPGGLVRYDGRRWVAVSKGLPAGTITSLLADHLGRLWIGSGLAGVARIDDPGAAQPEIGLLLKAGTLRSNQIVSLAEDTNGRIYIAEGRGVDRFDPATGTIAQFGAGGGPPPGETRKLFRDRSGAIWFGSTYGLARYVPQPDPAGPPPQPAIHEVRVSGVPALVSDEGETTVRIGSFPAGRGSIEIAFGSVDFSVDNRVRYRYRLLPVETDWRQPGSQRSANYAGLGANDYRFELQAVGPGGVVSATVAAVQFRVDGPFWRSWWFLVMAGASAAALAVAAHLYRLRHVVAVERVRSRLAADLHDDLGSGLAEIAILTEVAKQRGSVDGLGAVAQRARELRRNMSDIVWAVESGGDHLENLIRRWRQTAYALLGDDRLEFVAPAAAVTARVKLSSSQRRDLLLLFKEMVTNVARHSGANRVHIQVSHRDDWLALEVRDDGRGFDPQSVQAGTGLKSMRFRAQTLGGGLTIDSSAGAGTRIGLKVPLAATRMSMQLPQPPGPA